MCGKVLFTTLGCLYFYNCFVLYIAKHTPNAGNAPEALLLPFGLEKAL